MNLRISCRVVKRTRNKNARRSRIGSTEENYRYTVYATGGNRCPVMWYKIFAGHRPMTMLRPEISFFLGIDWKKKKTNAVWYRCQGEGINYISRFLPDAKKKYDLPGNISNHSVRKTGIGQLLDANVPEIYVAQHSGMKSTDSLSSYNHGNKDTQKQ